MRAAFTLLFLAISLSAADPKITVRGTGVKADAPLLVGDWRSYGVDNYAGTVDWEYDPLPKIKFDGQVPSIVYGDIGLRQSDKPLSTFRIVAGDLVDQEVKAGDAIIWGKADGDVRLVARGVVDGRAKRLATLLVTIGPRPPDKEPAPPPVKPTGSINFAIIQAPGPQTAQFKTAMELDAWKEIEKAGHNYSLLSVEKARGLGIPIPNTLPAIQPLFQNPETKKSRVIPPPIAMPYTDADVKKLLEVKP